MDWSDPNSVLTFLFSGSPIAILITLLVAFSLPVLLHTFLYRSAATSSGLPTFLLLGPSGSGKTSFITLLERSGQSVPDNPRTRTSQTPLTIHLTLRQDVVVASAKYRSENDTSLENSQYRRFAMIDTPGHGKLRSQYGLTLLSSPAQKKTSKGSGPKIKGVVFFVDSAFPSGDSQIQDTAQYFHDVLLALQKQATSRPQSRRGKDEQVLNVLIAANKQDLFTALPPATIKARLEREIETLRKTRSKGLLDSGVGVGADAADAEEKDMLGRDDGFSFSMFEEDTGIRVEVVGGSARGEEGVRARRWEEWLGSCL